MSCSTNSFTMSDLSRRSSLSFFGGAGVPPAINGRRDACPTYSAARGILDTTQRKRAGFLWDSLSRLSTGWKAGPTDARPGSLGGLLP